MFVTSQMSGERLSETGLSEAQLTTLTVDNPRRYFERQGAY